MVLITFFLIEFSFTFYIETFFRFDNSETLHHFEIIIYLFIIILSISLIANISERIILRKIKVRN